jgi:uncharacterized RDD family membrane protein YckC
MTADVPRRLPTYGGHVPQEAREFQGQRAGIVSRVLANTVDFAVLVCVLIGAYLGWSAIRFLIDPATFTFPQTKPARVLIFGGFLLGLYFWISWATTGRAVGNKLMGLRVVGFRGRLMRWSGALLRAIFCVVLPIGLFWAVVSRQNRSIQDAVLRSSVIYDWGQGRTRLGREPRGTATSDTN